ncbi:Hypothetical predicted protein [Pelobates cultripes]|uniref:Uncharacterized protein n=1 Tax=Pelobates cultripes TaxID=61616 RepID=A0AAD1VVH3_PELCU|nr:Hypothetical predicted protein [Pelobates cultripes]
MSQRHKSKTAKADKASFFLTRASALKAREGLNASQGGGDAGSRDSSPSPLASPSLTPDDWPLTMGTMRTLMAELSDTIQATIRGQMQAVATELREEIHEISQRTEHIAKERDEYARARNSVADKLQENEALLGSVQLKLADMEDRSQRNNLHI